MNKRIQKLEKQVKLAKLEELRDNPTMELVDWFLENYPVYYYLCGNVDKLPILYKGRDTLGRVFYFTKPDVTIAFTPIVIEDVPNYPRIKATIERELKELSS